MFEFIPKKLSSHEAFPLIDRFYDGWFTARNLGWGNVMKYFPGADRWDRETLFSGLLWMYYNYPIDFVASDAARAPGAKVFRKANFWRVACFLVNSELTKNEARNILTKLIDSNAQGDYPAAKDRDSFEIEDALKGEGFTNAEERVIDMNKNHLHPFGKKTKDGVVPIPELKKRIDPKVIFTKKAITVDKNLIPYLNLEFLKYEGLREDLRDIRRANQPVIKVAPRAPRIRLLDQFKHFTGDKSAKKAPKYVKELKHKVTTKRFIPFVLEDIDLDIDPNLIADKIREISKTRSDFSTESFSSRRQTSPFAASRSGTPLNWEDEASSIEL